MITTFLDPTQLPSRTQEQAIFDVLMGRVMQLLPTWGGEINAALGQFNASLAGGAYALPYIFDAATADADPGAGKLRLSSATQNAAATMRLDVLAGGQDVGSILDTFDAASSAVKGSIRLVKMGDLSKWLTFDITARSAPSGYRNLAVSNTGGSSANPFSAGDGLLLYFQRNGDAGTPIVPAYSYLGGGTFSTPVATIGFLNIFSSIYDKYVIELSSFNFSAASNLNMVLAVSGAIPSSASMYYSALLGHGISSSETAASVAQLTPQPIYTGGGVASVAPLTIEICNVNNNSAKSINVRGSILDNANTVVYGVSSSVRVRSSTGGLQGVTGFRLQPSVGNFVSATVAVYGIKNS